MQARNDQRVASVGAIGGPQTGNHPVHGVYGHLTQGNMNYNLQGIYGQMQNAQLHNSHMHSKDVSSQQHGINPAAVENLNQAFTSFNIGGFGTANSGKSVASMQPTSASVSALNGSQNNGQMCYQLPDGRILVSGISATQAPYQQANGINGAYSFAPSQAQYLQQGNYQVSSAIPNTPQNAAWNVNQQFARDIPDLAAPRRSSYSSNEENGPHTPFFGGGGQGDYQPKIAVAEISPQAWSTPSPQNIGQGFYPQQLAKGANGQYTFIDLDSLCQQEPAIPRPIPAIFSGENGRGTLEKSLSNLRNTTNVYIRGLRPDTNDEMLHSYGARFGDIISAKSMLDQHTEQCKGFGFIKYHNFNDGENCIRGFFHWGYEAKWARVSHNEKLKTLGDPENTNLYVSNLPLSFNEHTLMAIFEPTSVLSAKILRDGNGMSRGVGFARFASAEICNEIIENYNGKPIGEDGAILSIRFADTQAQKQLKVVTAERRQFKTNEYNMSVSGAMSPYQMSPTTGSFPSPLQTRMPMPVGNGYWPTQAPVSPLYPTYSPVLAPYLGQSVSAISGIKPSVSSENVPPPGRYNARIKIESPSAVALAKRAAVESTVASSPHKRTEDSSKICAGSIDAKSSPAKSKHSGSPAKSSPSKSFTGRL